MSKSTILLKTETRQLLRRIGRKEQTYDDVINELVAIREECEQKTKMGESSGQEAPPTKTAMINPFTEVSAFPGVIS